MFQIVKSMVFGNGERPRKILFGIAGGVRFIIDPKNKSQRLVGLDEAEISGVFRRAVTDVRTFIDVGASDGYYVIIAHWLNKSVISIGCDSDVHFEPRARENYKLNFSEASDPHAFEWVTQSVGDGVGQVSLDSLGAGRRGPILIKIDVDGFEIDVLQSGKQLLARNDCRVLVEVHSAELESSSIRLLESHGFRCRVIKNAWWRMIFPERRIVALNRWLFADKG